MTTIFDGCGPCTNCGNVFQMKFSDAVCPNCNKKMSRDDAFFSCASYPYSVPPTTNSPPAAKIEKLKTKKFEKVFSEEYIKEAVRITTSGIPNEGEINEAISLLTKVIELNECREKLVRAFFLRGLQFYSLSQKYLSNEALNKVLEFSKLAQSDFKKAEDMDPTYFSDEDRKGLRDSILNRIATLENYRGGIFSSVWNFVSGKWKCPKCGYRKTSELSRDVDYKTEWERDYGAPDGWIQYRRTIFYICQIKCFWCNYEYTDYTSSTEKDKRN